MPLIQWIMQNLSQVQAQKEGVVVGGSANVYKEINLTTSGGVIVGGSAILPQNVPIVFAGGVVVGGKALIEQRANKRRKIRFAIGQKVYDKNNRPHIVTGFEYNYPGEPIYRTSNGIKSQRFYESSLSAYPQKFYVNPENKINCITNTPTYNFPIYTGIKSQKITDVNTGQNAQKVRKNPENEIKCINNTPLYNFPVFDGKRKVKL